MDGESNQAPADESREKRHKKKQRQKRKAEKLSAQKDDTVVSSSLWFHLF